MIEADEKSQYSMNGNPQKLSREELLASKFQNKLYSGGPRICELSLFH